MATHIFRLRGSHGMDPAQIRRLEGRIDAFLQGLAAAGRNVVGVTGTEPNYAGADRKWKVVSEDGGTWQVEIL